MTRAEVAALVGRELATVLADAGMTTADEAAGLQDPIDRALRSMGYAKASVATAAPPEDDEPLFEAAVTYHALRKAWRALGTKMRISVGGDSFDLAKKFENVGKLLEDAAAIVISLGGVTGSGGLWIGTMDLAFTAADADADEFALVDA